MEAALEEFSAKNYENASLNNIIKNAGISKGTFYYHFQDKGALYFALIRDMADAKIEFVGRRMQDYDGKEELNFFDNLRLQAKSGMEFAKEYPKYYRFGLMFLKERGNWIYTAAREMLNDTTETYFKGSVEKAVMHGDVRPGLSVTFITKLVIHLLIKFDEILDIDFEKSNFDNVYEDICGLIDFMQYGLGSGKGEHI